VAAPASRATGPRPPGRGPPRSGFSRPSTPRPPPTPEGIAALARKERVPARIAKGELEGKMKCRIWKKLHAEEAKRFDQAFTLMETNPALELADAFGVVQSGLTVEEFQARRSRAKKKAEVKVARAAVPGAPIDAFIEGLVSAAQEVGCVLGERALIDVVTAVHPVSFDLLRTGSVDKLQVVLLTRRSTWEQLLPTLERDQRLSQKPASVARQPSRRPVSDPRLLHPKVGETVVLLLRNGITLRQPLLAVGPYDVLVGQPGDELFVPLHAMLSWQTV
jgi:hypothetical protein